MRGIAVMLMELAWNAFEKTGNINFYVMYKEIQEENDQLKEISAAVLEVAISS